MLENKIQCIVFDWAGTMIDYGSRAPAKVFQETFRQHGIEISIQQAREPMGMAKREHIAAILKMDSVEDAWKSEFERLPNQQDIDRLYIEFQPLQLSVIKDFCELIPGALETFQWCRSQQIRVASSTGYTREIMAAVTPVAAAAGYEPEVVLCAEDAPAGRPAPWLIYESARRCNVYPMSRVAKVDDTVVGIEAGRNAGCWTIGIAKTGNMLGLSQQEAEQLDANELQKLLDDARQKFLDAGAHFVVDGVADVPQLIGQINQEIESQPKVSVVSSSPSCLTN